MVRSSFPTSRNSAGHRSGFAHCNPHQGEGLITPLTASPHLRTYAGHTHQILLLYSTLTDMQVQGHQCVIEISWKRCYVRKTIHKQTETCQKGGRILNMTTDSANKYKQIKWPSHATHPYTAWHTNRQLTFVLDPSEVSSTWQTRAREE